MSLHIVGSGRCGTKSITATFGGDHEPACDIILPLALQYALGAPTEYVQALLPNAGFGEVQGHYRYAELIPEIARFDVGAKFLWVRRDANATVTSMMRKGWYDPRDDVLWPLSFAQWAVDQELTPHIQFFIPHNAYRVTAAVAGQMSYPAWGELPQRARCEWWVAYSEWLTEQHLRDQEHAIVDIESVTLEVLERIGEWAGVPVVTPGVPHMRT